MYKAKHKQNITKGKGYFNWSCCLYEEREQPAGLTPHIMFSCIPVMIEQHHTNMNLGICH